MDLAKDKPYQKAGQSNQAKTMAEDKKAKKRVAEAGTYFINNWDGICAWRFHEDQVIGCSAEGHVSHVLSARLSSRPMGWSKLGADQIAKLRAMAANGYNIPELVYKKYEAEMNSKMFIISEENIENVQQRLLKKVSGEVFGNLPVLDTKFSLTRQAIRGLSNGYYKLI